MTESAAPASGPLIIPLGEGPENRLEGERPDRQYAVIVRPELHVWRAEKPWARVLLFAGGGYTKIVYDKEGPEVAAWLTGLGVEANLLIHRLPGAPDGRGGRHAKDIALLDGLRALDHLAGEKSGLPLFHFGLSSGGHLAGVMACQPHRLKAAGALICYAPINANHRAHKFPAGKPDYPPVEKQDFYDDWPIGLAEHRHGLPKVPVFLAYAAHDRSVPLRHALNYAETASALELDVDLHVFADAPHGFALRSLDGTQAAWPGLAADWMRRKAGLQEAG
ncbi:alpha/beta hydrolase family protein [Martelella radicis]|uniref:Acetyl esterase/lipase n=1 Tax=Martelella radicis TaxID=1397476 RepID=A0A7W6KIV8_9HYPH|nr:alpha/beta hydrolase [Martelella radicis]MBB4121978.1 acetyl esterase/lipase [Martelella radicis]